MHLDILCSLSKFCKKKIIFYVLCKNFVFFTQATKNIFSHQNFGRKTQNVQMHARNFCSDFLIF
jgi:hypothetical protein